MRYIIITLVIAAILTLLSYFLDFANDKYDRYFLIFISVVLVSSGLFFSIKSENLKEKEEKDKVAKIDTTLTNTEKLKNKADSIIYNLNESLDKTISINDNLNTQNETLLNVEEDVKKQIKALNKTLKQTEVFQKMVDEQNQRAIAQFERDSAKVQIYTNDIKFVSVHNDSSYNFKFLLKNSGKRTANNVKVWFNLFLIEENQKMFLKDIELKYESVLNPILGKNNQEDYAGFVQLRKIFTFDELKNKIKSAYLIIKINYEDESNKKPIEENYFYLWNGFKEHKFTFVNLPQNPISLIY